jgi:hypothetical protein
LFDLFASSYMIKLIIFSILGKMTMILEISEFVLSYVNIDVKPVSDDIAIV